MTSKASLFAALALWGLASAEPSGCSRRRPLPGASSEAGGNPPLTFNRSIEPILSENCYQCHGPDPGGRKAGLRLDRGEFALSPHDKVGPAVIPYDPDHSPLLQRISSRDPHQVMPPPESHKTLSAGEIALLRRWIGAGPPYGEHWSFLVPRRPALPAIRRPGWAHGDNLYRRSVYTFIKRLVIMPNMEAFDSPSRDSACTGRSRSDTPLQALVTTNDPQWLEAARSLGEWVFLQAGTTAGRLDLLGKLLLGRPWQPEERAVLTGELERLRSAYGNSAAAAKLVVLGESAPDPKISPRELAPWMLVASTALNLDGPPPWGRPGPISPRRRNGASIFSWAGDHRTWTYGITSRGWLRSRPATCRPLCPSLLNTIGGTRGVATGLHMS